MLYSIFSLNVEGKMDVFVLPRKMLVRKHTSQPFLYILLTRIPSSPYSLWTIKERLQRRENRSALSETPSIHISDGNRTKHNEITEKYFVCDLFFGTIDESRYNSRLLDKIETRFASFIVFAKYFNFKGYVRQIVQSGQNNTHYGNSRFIHFPNWICTSKLAPKYAQQIR